MNSIKNVLIKFWRPAVWTVLYVLFVYAVMRGLFNFNLFSAADLMRLTHVELHGFAGFAFGILVLAALPMYVATTVFTVRKGEMPIKIPLPNCFTPPEPEPVSEPVPVVVEQEILPDLPRGVPAEMRESFMRARRNYGARQTSIFNKINAGAPVVAGNSPVPRAPTMVAQDDIPQFSPIIDTAVAENDALADDTDAPMFPIPDDFDVVVDDVADVDVPVFSDINFDDDEDDEEDADAENIETIDSVCEYLKSSGIKAAVDGDMIVANDAAVAVHGDRDFWIADEIDWFAPGKQKPSPIVELLTAAQDKGLRPVLYLASTNIMDLEKLLPMWRENGITVAQSMEELVEVVSG